ncbi:protein of unknown function [Methylotuvimicrobium alcaliphilum 20Z]|uniref:ABC transporter domain-containing protein n=1 Tax=Methylotuvimicrobium alcaliphilum (strain DSM 19304 / NCIMB 14124 / VKM B-2133 / 20Z) TaxID=1091494 RepID=G4SU53_META2|nr:protein of unknown function [Methylotuvimicrobium alcaliphilum 20Z]
MSLLALSHVVYAAGPKKILDDLDFGIDEGDVHALIGTNGTGKSTLARLIIGSEGFRLSSGQIVFDGRDIGAWTMYERAVTWIAWKSSKTKRSDNRRRSSKSVIRLRRSPTKRLSAPSTRNKWRP